jgi:hypothetical protein
MPGARCTRGLVCKLHKRKRTRAYRSAEALRNPLRNGFTAYIALSPATNSSCHRHRRIEDFAEPGWARENLRQLDTSNGCQDHTVLPYASASSSACPRSLTGNPPCDSVSRLTLLRPPHPIPTLVTMANAPLLGTGWGELLPVICPTAKAKYFCKKGLDRIY